MNDKPILKTTGEGLKNLMDASENAVIAFRMGWDMDGVIGRLEAAVISASGFPVGSVTENKV